MKEATKEIEPIPADMTGIRTGYGPCLKAPDAQFLVINTNQYGPIEVHQCSLCKEPQLLSSRYGWIDVVDDEGLQQRINQEVAKAPGVVPGWR